MHELRENREPWQRADATLDNLDGPARSRNGRRRRSLPRQQTSSSCLQITGGGADELLRTLRGLGNVSVLNLPADDPAADALRMLGATPAVRQREMVLEL